MKPHLVLTFDVEEFDLPLEYGRELALPAQLETGAEGWKRILDLLDLLGLPATLFTTAQIAEAFPELLKRSALRHEIASHNVRHARECPPQPSLARRLLQEACGQEIAGYRSPRFAPVSDRELLEAGHWYNSSLNPVWLPGRYNHAGQPRRPFLRHGLLQFPLSATPGLRIPLFWLAFKNLPLPVFEFLCRWVLLYDRCLHLYFHPWEFCDLQDSGVPAWLRQPDGPRLLDKLRRLLVRLEPHVMPMPAAAHLKFPICV